jgi:hypothetical protein
MMVCNLHYARITMSLALCCSVCVEFKARYGSGLECRVDEGCLPLNGSIGRQSCQSPYLVLMAETQPSTGSRGWLQVTEH